MQARNQVAERIRAQRCVGVRSAQGPDANARGTPATRAIDVASIRLRSNQVELMGLETIASKHGNSAAPQARSLASPPAPDNPLRHSPEKECGLAAPGAPRVAVRRDRLQADSSPVLLDVPYRHASAAR